MPENSATLDWAAARGEKWRAQLSGMDPMLAPVDEPLLAALQFDAPCRIAEVGCGGGATALEIARRAPAGSVVHGFDLAASLVEVARGRARSGDRAIAFEVADMATAAPAAPYARLISRFGVMFFDDARGAFANLARWLEPGGRFAFAVWGSLHENPWLAQVRGVLAQIIELPQPDPDAPGPFRYADVRKLLALLEQAGFAELAAREWRGALSIGGGLPPDAAADFALSAFSNFSELLAQAGDAARDEARRALTARFSQHQQSGEVRLDACVHICTGTRA